MLAWLRRARGLALAGTAGLVLSVGAPAFADSTSDAQREAAKILAKVQRIQAKAKKAEASYERTLSGLTRAVNVSDLTDRAYEKVTTETDAAQQSMTNRVRSLYMAGGPENLYATLLQAGSFNDFQDGVVLVQSVVSSDRGIVAQDQTVVEAMRARANQANKQANSQIATARNVAQTADEVLRLLAEQQQLLDQANAKVAHLQALDAARAALAAQSAAFGSITATELQDLTVLPPSAPYLALYHHAAATCPGLSWTVLAAIGQVESGHGRNPSTSSAGAMGPMQFLPSTFARYAVDGNHDGKTDIMAPADAIYTAATYLCANGAGSGATGLAGAVWHYNHADWYVQMVLSLAKKYVGYAG